MSSDQGESFQISLLALSLFAFLFANRLHERSHHAGDDQKATLVCTEHRVVRKVGGLPVRGWRDRVKTATLVACCDLGNL